MSARTAPRTAVGCGAASVLLVATVAALGPSAAQAALGDGPLPLRAAVHPPAGLVTALLDLAVLLGALGLAAGVVALRRGWAPAPRRLLLAGGLAAFALAMLPPVASADPLNYAFYGHVAATGHDPYVVTAAGQPPDDAFARLVRPPWRDTPSVYGPVATAEQAAVAALVGDRPALAVWLLDLLDAAAFVATGALLLRVTAGHDPVRRRAAWLWSANPLLLYTVVAGAHVDALVALGVVAALAALRRTATGAGALVAAATLVKVTAALPAAALAWPLRRQPGRSAAYVGTATAVVVAGYAVAGPHALGVLHRASRRVSFATPWRPVTDGLDRLVAPTTARTVVGALAVVLAVALVWRLVPTLPGPGPLPGWRLAAALTVGWAFAAPYALPWYDALPWALLAVLPVSRVTVLLLAHTTWLSLAYVPGLDVALPTPVHATVLAVRSVLGPVVLGAVVVAVLRGGAAAGRARRPATR